MMELSSSILRQYGLAELIPVLEGWIRDGKSWDEFEIGFYDRGTEQGKVVDRLYPELRMRQEGGSAPMSITQIRDYRDGAKALMRQYGLPEGFYDEPEDFQQFIVGDVSLSELNQRVQNGFVAASSAPTEVREAMKNLYGVDEGGLAAYFLDPTRATPLLERQFATAQIAGTAGRVGVGVDKAQAEQLAALGVTQADAERGFGEIAEGAEFFDPLPGENADSISRSDQLDAVFGGNAANRRRIQQRQRKRQAAFEGGGSFASGDEGFSGIG